MEFKLYPENICLLGNWFKVFTRRDLFFEEKSWQNLFLNSETEHSLRQLCLITKLIASKGHILGATESRETSHKLKLEVQDSSTSYIY